MWLCTNCEGREGPIYAGRLGSLAARMEPSHQGDPELGSVASVSASGRVRRVLARSTGRVGVPATLEYYDDRIGPRGGRLALPEPMFHVALDHDCEGALVALSSWGIRNRRSGLCGPFHCLLDVLDR